MDDKIVADTVKTIANILNPHINYRQGIERLIDVSSLYTEKKKADSDSYNDLSSMTTEELFGRIDALMAKRNSG